MVKTIIKALLNRWGYTLTLHSASGANKKIYHQYEAYTMVSEQVYCDNLQLVKNQLGDLTGDIVECGVWRGGMIAGIAQLLGKKHNYYLFDSFEGLPASTEKDGIAAKKYQSDKSGPHYFDNCTADSSFAEQAMRQTGATYQIAEGWFKATLPVFETTGIAVLRLDGDWYDSTMECLKNLYPKVVKNGLIIIDDYYTWDGCSRAVHDYLSQINSASKINKTYHGTSYLIKQDED